MASKIQIINERLDEIVLLLHIMIKMELPQLLTKHLGRHWKQLGLDWGWVIVIWLAYIISEGDHRKVSVRDWVAALEKDIDKYGQPSTPKTLPHNERSNNKAVHTCQGFM
jgi:transposase